MEEFNVLLKLTDISEVNSIRGFKYICLKDKYHNLSDATLKKFLKRLIQ